MTVIRAARSAQDIATLAALGEAMHADSTFANMAYDPMIAAETLLRLVDNPDGLVLMACEGDTPVGGIAAIATRSFFGPDKVSSEFAVYVQPDKRGAVAALDLLRHYVVWARTKGVKRISAGNSAGMDDARFVRLLSRLGFKRAGSLMYLEV